MKILFIGPKSPPLTGQSIANDMACFGLQQQGHEVIEVNTITQQDISDVNRQGRLAMGKIFNSGRPLLHGIFRLLMCNIQLCYISPGQSFLGYIRFLPYVSIASLLRIPVVAHFHGGYFRQMFDGLSRWPRMLVQFQLHLTKRNIVLGASLKNMFLSIVDENSITICANGVQKDFHFTPEEIIEKQQNFAKSEKIQILFLSNLIRSKGILDLMEAVKILARKGCSVHCTLAGAIDSDVQDIVLDELKNFSNIFTYKGVVSGQHKRDLLFQSHIFCLPTYYPVEGQPISILEAYAAACPVVTTLQGGIIDIFTPSVHGSLCEPKNPASIACAIEKVWAHWVSHSTVNYTTYAQHFSAEAFYGRLDGVLSDVKRSFSKGPVPEHRNST
jgi:glycosyltransferase involved in cell wall biosynthesis